MRSWTIMHVVAVAAIAMITARAPAECNCLGDVNDDSMIGFPDLLQVVSAWGVCAGPCVEDLDDDGVVGFPDLLAVLAAWGPCAQPGACCLPDAPCVIAACLDGSDCAAQGGLYLGPDSVCADFNQSCPDACAPNVTLGSPTSNGPNGIRGLDFDRDGDTDFVLADIATFGLTVHRNNGLGVLTAGPAITTDFIVRDTATGDFDADGNPDLAVTGYGEVLILLGNGDGTFVPAGPSIPIPDGGGSVASGQFDGDRHFDLLVNMEFGLVLLRGQGDGSFIVEALMMFPKLMPRIVLAGDLDGDGDLDAVTGSANADNTVCIFRNDGTGALTQTDCMFLTHTINGLQFADMNGDAHLDIVGAGLSGSIEVALNQGDGSFIERPPFNIGSGFTTPQLGTGDFNQDGYPDIAVAYTYDFSGGVAPATYLFLAWGRGDGTFAFITTLELNEGSPYAPSALYAGDLSDNGADDLAIAGGIPNRLDTYLATCPGPSDGGCCLPDVTCVRVNADACAAAGGSFIGVGTVCNVDCTRGACCWEGDCIFISPAVCNAIDGTFLGSGLACETVICP